MDTVTLGNGLALPKIGLGLWQVTEREQMKRLVFDAYETGYRMFDTAAAYGNEIALGKALADNGIPRDRVFLCDKAWNTSRGYHEVQEACKKSLKKLKTDYLDLYLLHWPASPKLHEDWQEINAVTWSGMESLYRQGLVRAVGVCNFMPHHLEALKKTAKVMPMVDQVECHPGMPQQETLGYCTTNHIQAEASSPLGNGQILQNGTLLGVAAQCGKTPAQVCLRWALQKGMAAIPKTVNRARLEDNIAVSDFELTSEQMHMIDAVPFCGGLALDPDEVTQFG